MRTDFTVAVEPWLCSTEKLALADSPGARFNIGTDGGEATMSTSRVPFMVRVNRGCSGSLLKTTTFFVISVCPPLGRRVTLISPSRPGESRHRR
jgi:hypothetical protein